MGCLPASPFLVKSLVTTQLARRVAESHGAVCYETFTGFKHMAGLAQQLEQAQLESDYEQIMERYQLRKDQDSQAAQNQKAMAALLAQAGDFSLYGALYGLTPEQIRRLEAHYAAQQES